MRIACRSVRPRVVALERSLRRGLSTRPAQELDPADLGSRCGGRPAARDRWPSATPAPAAAPPRPRARRQAPDRTRVPASPRGGDRVDPGHARAGEQPARGDDPVQPAAEQAQPRSGLRGQPHERGRERVGRSASTQRCRRRTRPLARVGVERLADASPGGISPAPIARAPSVEPSTDRSRSSKPTATRCSIRSAGPIGRPDHPVEGRPSRPNGRDDLAAALRHVVASSRRRTRR